MSRRRVVITGLGAITPLGSSVDQYWSGLLAGRSGIRRITHFETDGLPCQIAGEIPDFEPTAYLTRKDARRLPRFTQIALAAAIDAYKDSGLPDTPPDPERVGVVVGTAYGGIAVADSGILATRLHGWTRVNPFAIINVIFNLAAYQIANHFQVQGPNSTITTACASSTQAIGEGVELIRRGASEIVIAGGTDSATSDYIVAGFAAMRALPVNYNDRPAAASRPFDARREGFVLSEGAGMFILESLEHALARGAHIYAEVAGHASSGEGYHVAMPDPEARGPIRTMRWALEDAGLQPEHVDYINAHGTSTHLNDVTETRAILSLFGDLAPRIPVSSTKSMVGHAGGAAGALEAIACALSIRHNRIPPTINYEYPDPECPLDYVPNQARELQVDVTLSNSFGLGGQNACLVISRYRNDHHPT